MKIPVLAGTIKRRLLVNFRADAEVTGRQLPHPFRPKLHNGFAMVGICLIRLEHERPAGIPEFLGMSSENAAHRLAVEWTEPDGTTREGVYIPRRDTDSFANRLAGGRIFPVESHAASFTVSDSDGHIELSMKSQDGECEVEVVGHESIEFPATSCFANLEEASRFFQNGSSGYSPTKGVEEFLGIDLWTPEWRVGALTVLKVHSSYFENPDRFPLGSIEFDHALIMRNLKHEWRAIDEMSVVGSSA